MRQPRVTPVVDYPNTRNPVHAQVHRFRDRVAVYLAPKDARRLARAINTCARSCDREAFTESTCGTHSFTFEE